MNKVFFLYTLIFFATGIAEAQQKKSTPAANAPVKSLMPVQKTTTVTGSRTQMDSLKYKKLIGMDTHIPAKVLISIKNIISDPTKINTSKQTTVSTPPSNATKTSGQVAAPASNSIENTCNWPNNPGYPGEYGTGVTTCYNGYYLTGVTVKIYTGNDNKEYPSSIAINAYLPYGSDFGDAHGSSTLLYTNTMDNNNSRIVELKSNSNNSIKLTPVYTLFDTHNFQEYRPNEMSLYKVEHAGLVIVINYSPNLLTDAWKIEKVDITFNVSTPSGIKHPKYDNKTVTFTKSKLLTSGSGINDCYVMSVDGSLNAGLAY